MMVENWERHLDESTQSWYWINRDNGETRWDEVNDSVGEGAAGKAEEEEEVVDNDEYREVYIVRYKGGGPAFKHWALYVVDEQEESSGFSCHITGSRTNYRYECKRIDPHNDQNFIDMHQVGYVDTNALKEFKEFAEAKEVMNTDKYWGCQNWAWEILGELEEKGLLEHSNDFEEERETLGSLMGPGK